MWQPFDYEAILNNEIPGLGLKRVRLAVNSIDRHNIAWDKPELSIDPAHDEFITGLADYGITITYVLQFWDKATVARGESLPRQRFKTEEEIQRYLDFVRFIVRHFRDRVQYFELWNEPNPKKSTTWIEVEDYINLVRRVVPVIRQEYPEAKIQVGSVTGFQGPPDAEDSRNYLFTLLKSDVMPLVDVVSWHPMYGTSPEYYGEFYYEYPSFLQEIKDVASAHGFQGEYEADEITYSSPEVFWRNPDDPVNSEIVCAKYYARGVVMHLGVDVTVSVAGMSSLRIPSYTTVRNLCTVMAGAKLVSLSVKIESEATNIEYYSFSLSNGDRLLALWTDGVAIDDDPGIEATVTLPGFSAKKITGIDVLHGFEQELIAGIENRNLIIRNLLVKDYPIILRLAD